MEWKNIYRGLLMGASDVIPGVSGGTIAVLLGIYDRLIAAINGFFSKEWKKHLTFLIPLGIGMATAVLLLSRVIEWLFNHYPAPTNFFFFILSHFKTPSHIELILSSTQIFLASFCFVYKAFLDCLKSETTPISFPVGSEMNLSRLPSK